MALSANCVWEIRGGAGDDANGGAFVTGATGTDYSQQDTPQYALTGIATAGAGSTFLTASAATNMVGNILNVVSGTNFTTGRYQIISVVAGVSVTVDRAITTGVGASGVINIGGALNTLGLLSNTWLAGWIIYVKATATYTLTATVVVSNTAILLDKVKWIGYSSTRGDGGHPTITTATNSMALFTFSQITRGQSWSHFTFTSTAGTKAAAFALSGSPDISGIAFYDCVFDGLLSALVMRGGWNHSFTKCEIKNMTSDGLLCGNTNVNTSLLISECWIHDNAGDGIEFGGAVGPLFIRRSAIGNNGGDGVREVGYNATPVNHMVILCESAFYENGSDGVELSDPTYPLHLESDNCIFWDNAGYGISAQIAPFFLSLRTNAFGSNNGGGSGLDRLNVAAAGDEVTLTVDPFTDSATGDFELNATSGGGAALKGAGTPTAIP